MFRTDLGTVYSFKSETGEQLVLESSVFKVNSLKEDEGLLYPHQQQAFK